MTASIWLAVFVGVAASFEDLRRRRIPNWIPMAALLGAVSLKMFERDWRGLGMSALAAGIGFTVFLVAHFMGGRGAGDVKLMAGFAAILGPGRLWKALVWIAVMGGLIALTALAWNAVRNRTRPRERRTRLEYIAYAPAITLGSWLALIENP